MALSTQCEDGNRQCTSTYEVRDHQAPPSDSLPGVKVSDSWVKYQKYYASNLNRLFK